MPFQRFSAVLAACGIFMLAAPVSEGEGEPLLPGSDVEEMLGGEADFSRMRLSRFADRLAKAGHRIELFPAPKRQGKRHSPPTDSRGIRRRA